LVEAFKRKPGNISHASLYAAVSRPTAQRAWAFGWDEPKYRPIRELLEEETVAVRARLREKYREEFEEEEKKDPIWSHELAREEAIRALGVEAEMIRSARGQVVSGLNIVADVMTRVKTVAAEVAGYMDTMASPPEKLAMLKQLSEISKQLATAGQTVMEMERLHLGEPQKILGVAVAAPRMSLEEARREIEASTRALLRAEQLGLLTEGAKTVTVTVDATPLPQNTH